MPRFSANLSFLWPELDPYDRCRAAADAGFKAVEILFPHELDAGKLERALRDSRLELVLFDAPPGNRAAGERGMLCIPGREEECLAAVQIALEMADRFGTKRINLLAGMLPPGLSRDRALSQAADVLLRAADLAGNHGVQLLIENISPPAAAGYFASTVEQAAELVEAVGHPAAGLQLDQYHVCMCAADPMAEFDGYARLVRHIQIADAPDRHQPGTGSSPIAPFLHHLDERGYASYVGLEYHPLGSMDQALAWLPRESR